ncbi:pre-mRNA-splicing factor PRP46 [Rhodotorula toruloides]|uniref:Pre-mRNA-splicing factor PRP46 n=1 Tax=Rhodotorula toruloides TaxID=5286 RepID=A0A511KER1_RHOTO|nr:pre-mRNA-splicing factor PRP46 [Rhodotorula toruloides]
MTDSLPPIDHLVRKSAKRAHAVFSAEQAFSISNTDDANERSTKLRLASKIEAEYRNAKVLPAALVAQQKGAAGPARPAGPQAATGPQRLSIEGPMAKTVESLSSQALTTTSASLPASHAQPTLLSQSLIRRREARQVKPDYHAPWKLTRVISGHLGWVRAVAVEPGNKWFATGAGDRVIKIWDLASGELKLSLTGHISTVRGLAVSPRHPYLFSLHPTLDVLITAGRDASARVWDMRTKAQVHVLTGHTATISDVKAQESDPQVITGSMDSTVRLWDLAAGKTMTTLTHHHKSVRSIAIHPTEYSFATASAGGNNIKKWACPNGTFVHNFSGHDAIINSISVNPDGVFFSGGDNGSMTWWDWKTGLPFQADQDKPQPGSLDAEAGIFCSTFDQTGTRLITGGADKTIKIYSEQA